MVIFLIAFVLLLVIGVPISISIGASAVLGCLSLGYPLVVIGQKMVSGIDSFLLIAVPLFILAGNLMNAGKITEKIFDTAKELVGWIPGGLGHANVVASIIFAGMSGSAVADAGGLGAIEMEAMKKNGYDEDFAGAVTAASSVIGPIFPALHPPDHLRKCGQRQCGPAVHGRRGARPADGRTAHGDGPLLCHRAQV